MSSSNNRRRRRAAIPIDDLVDSYTRRRGYPQVQPHPPILPTYVDCGDCDLVCSHCGALFWNAERSTSHSRKDRPVYTRCCKLGTVVLPPSGPTPPELLSLYGERSFRENIRSYNSLFAMTSFGAKVDNTVNDGLGPYTFKVSGQISHWIGSLCPDPAVGPRFLQLYIYDTSNEVNNRLRIGNATGHNTLNPDTVALLSNVLGSYNKYARLFKTAKQLADDRDLDQYSVRLYTNFIDRRYSLPECDMVGCIVSGDDMNANSFDVIVHSKDGHAQRISKLHPAYMPLQYPLLFPNGEPGWSTDLRLTVNNGVSSKAMSNNMYYSYLCHDRQSTYSLIVNSSRLYQQFLVDSYVCIEQCRLDYIRNHQNELRSDYVSGLYDALSRGDSDGRSVGKRVLLPSTFVGGPRYMYSHYQDALAISRVYGNPQYFVTFTCNAGWSEVKRFMSTRINLHNNDRPDILSRLFRMKVLEFIDFLKKDKVFGDISAYLYTIEFQKRGLPHCHTLLWVSEASRIKTPDDIEKYICAELPDPETEQELYNIITGCMLHGPCGSLNLNAPCMRDGVCKKGFPKPFNDKTFFDNNGYVHYKRRDVSYFTSSNGVKIHNGFVVPYNKRLSSRFNAHINVEYCGWNMMIKYLFKYISKGVDRVSYILQTTDVEPNTSNSSTLSPSSSFQPSPVQVIDEVQNFVDGRFICPHEAAWRILNFPIHERHPSVQVLAVHLPNMQSSTFRDNTNLQTLIDSPTFGRTTLTRWLASNSSDSAGISLKYIEYPTVFRWEKTKKDWVRRSLNCTPSVGRLVYVHPTSGELFYLRMLLCHQVGCQKFEDIRTVAGHVYGTYRMACVALGLIGEDKEWLDAFLEAASWASAPQLRTLFCHLLLFCDVSNPDQLWAEAWPKMGDDISHAYVTASTSSHVALTNDTLKNQILVELEKILNGCTPSKSLKDYNLPLPSGTPTNPFTNRLLIEESSYDTDYLRQQHSEMVSKLNSCQRVIYDRVRNDFIENKQTLLFVYGHGGTGKTFLWSTLLSFFRSNGHIILAVAASGIASLLLPSGRTAHSRFNIPINVTDGSICNIKKRSHLAALLKKTCAVIWDEATMTDRRCFECVDRSFRDILERRDVVFGGISMLLGGDFRQTLPVKRKKNHSEIIDSTLPNSILWPFFTLYKLYTNMRLSSTNKSNSSSTNIEKFASWILAIGDGNIGDADPLSPNYCRFIDLPTTLLLPPSEDYLQSLISFVYGGDVLKNPTAHDLRERAIVCPKNDTTSIVNTMVLNMAPGEPVTHYSNDSIIPYTRHTTDFDLLYPPEYLNSLNFPGLPLHKLVLKQNSPIVLLRNLNPRLGLCNGTRLVVTQQLDNIIEATIITGTNVGNRVYIPRIPLVHVDSELPFTFVRRQFPCRICYAMTINKSQGQSLNKIGVYLPQPVFSHGQLYVALSRSTSPDSIKVVALDENGEPTNKTKNVVFQEFLKQLDLLESDGIALLGKNDDQAVLENTLQLGNCFKISEYTCLEITITPRVLRNPIHLSIGAASTIVSLDNDPDIPKEWFDFGTIDEFRYLIDKPKFYPATHFIKIYAYRVVSSGSL